MLVFFNALLISIMSQRLIEIGEVADRSYLSAPNFPAFPFCHYESTTQWRCRSGSN